MKIAIITDSCDLYSGSRAAVELAIALKQIKEVKEVLFIAFSTYANSEAISKLNSAKVKLYLIPNQHNNILSRFISGRALLRIAQLRQVDILSLHISLPLFFWSKLLPKPSLYTYYGTQFDAYLENKFGEQKTFLHSILNLFFNIAIYFSHTIPLIMSGNIVTISQYCVEELRKLYRVKANYVYIGSTQPIDTRPVKTTKKSINLISISRFTPYKGFHHLIKIVSRINQETDINCKLVIIGSGPKNNYFKFIHGRKYNWLSIKQNISEENRLRYLSMSHIYVSFDRYLFLGLPLIEGAMNGLPAVVMDHCAASEVVSHHLTGFVAKSEEQFISFLRQLCLNDKLRRKMSISARTVTTKKFKWETCANEYHTLFKKILRE